MYLYICRYSIRVFLNSFPYTFNSKKTGLFKRRIAYNVLMPNITNIYLPYKLVHGLQQIVTKRYTTLGIKELKYKFSGENPAYTYMIVYVRMCISCLRMYVHVCMYIKTYVLVV